MCTKYIFKHSCTLKWYSIHYYGKLIVLSSREQWWNVHKMDRPLQLHPDNLIIIKGSAASFWSNQRLLWINTCLEISWENQRAAGSPVTINENFRKFQDGGTSKLANKNKPNCHIMVVQHIWHARIPWSGWDALTTRAWFGGMGRKTELFLNHFNSGPLEIKFTRKINVN